MQDECYRIWNRRAETIPSGWNFQLYTENFGICERQYKLVMRAVANQVSLRERNSPLAKSWYLERVSDSKANKCVIVPPSLSSFLQIRHSFYRVGLKGCLIWRLYFLWPRGLVKTTQTHFLPSLYRLQITKTQNETRALKSHGVPERTISSGFEPAD